MTPDRIAALLIGATLTVAAGLMLWAGIETVEWRADVQQQVYDAGEQQP